MYLKGFRFARCSAKFLKFAFCIVALIGALSLSENLLCAPFEFPKGVTIYDSAKVYPGYTLFSVEGKDAVYLIDMNGTTVHEWQVPGVSNQVKPLPYGHILVIVGTDPEYKSVLREYDWEGNLVWQFPVPEKFIDFNHDLVRLPNGNTLSNASVMRKISKFLPRSVVDNVLLEVTPTGKIAWEWSTLEHYNQLGLSERAKKYLSSHEGFVDIFHTNSIQVLPHNKYENEDARFAAGNILVSQRHSCRLFIIDKSTGSVVWSTSQTIAQHHASMIPPSLTGGGDILVLDNGGSAGYPKKFRPYSIVREFDPKSLDLVWKYEAADNERAPDTFFSLIRGSAQRLPNGNTLIVESTFGRIFEVTSDKKIVWEYVSPYYRDDVAGRQGNLTGLYTNQLYRAYRVDDTWPEGAVGPGDEPFIW